ncbi:Uncharacterized protein TCM_008590 [Theobroma cacao]|uniref:Ubiquitin-like protease family profile domain-containing protein n=1 Tax=Theobroma cacao TaxID=3641 RepID=A0A061E400_THECC|nr:Uncharacterized protein TCM_008590 [Theobroma cacao]
MKILTVCLLCRRRSGRSMSLLTPTMGDALALVISEGHRRLECLPIGSLCLEADLGLPFEGLWAVKTLEPTPDKARREYSVDIDVPLSEGHQYLDHATIAPQPPRGHFQTYSANEPSLMEGTTTPQRSIGPAQPHSANEPPIRILNEKLSDFERYTGRKLIVVRMHFRYSENDTVASRCSEKLSVFWVGDASLRDIGDDHEDADDGQRDKLSVHIHHDVIAIDEENVTYVNDAVVGDVTFQSDDAEEDHVLETDSIIDASLGGKGDLHLGDHLHQSTPKGSASWVSLLELSDVHHLEALISDPTERARVKMVSKYMASPYVNPSVSYRDVNNSMVEGYKAFNKDKRNVEILGDQEADIFTTLEDPKEEMTSEQIDACLSILCKRMTGPKLKLYNSRAYVVDTIFFVKGKRPTYSKKWEDVDFILAPCNVGGHWVVAKINLVRWTIKVVDSARTSDAKDNNVRVAQMTPLMTMIPIICHKASYFHKTSRKT